MLIYFLLLLCFTVTYVQLSVYISHYGENYIYFLICYAVVSMLLTCVCSVMVYSEINFNVVDIVE